MDEIESFPPSPNPKKRAASDEEISDNRLLNLKGTQFMPTPPDTDQSSNTSPTCSNEADGRQMSPAPSDSTLTSVDITGTNDVNVNALPNATGTAGSAARPAKRRKLSPAEKEQQKVEKEAKDVERAIQKSKRDEEKRVKDEEKRKKAEERDAKKREKEVEEERKTQDKLKKERSQMRLGVFFQKPATPAKTDGDDEVRTTSSRRKSLSLEPFDAVVDQIRGSQSPCKRDPPTPALITTPMKPTLSDYSKYFLPFQLQTNCSMPSCKLAEDRADAQDIFDHDIADPSLQEKYDLGLVDTYSSLESHFADEMKYIRGQALPSTRQLVDQLQGFLRQPIDLTGDEAPVNATAVLQTLSLRYLEFSEDVRPPYFGTYTKVRSQRTTVKLRRNPFTRGRKDTDYDYDSEAEWEPPEEGDDECIEEEEETESQGDVNEMDEFLDDEEDALRNKRKMFTGDLVPASTGLCWEDEAGRVVPSIEGGLSVSDLNDMRIGVLVHGFSGSTMDPFSTKYWSVPSIDVQPASTTATNPFVTQQGGIMAPPRPPLQPRLNTNTTLDRGLVGAAEGQKGPISSVAATQGSKTKAKAAPKPLSKEDLDEFKDAVVGSPLSKADLLKGLKTRYVVEVRSFLV